MSPPPAPKIAAAVASYRRDDELRRLLASLAGSRTPVSPVVVADNASSETTRKVCEQAGARWLPRAANNGPGAAWNTAIAGILEDKTVSHILVLDDDVVPGPEAVGLMLDVMTKTACGAVAPLLFDARNQLWGFPEPREPALRKTIRQARGPASCLVLLGADPHLFCWATGACMLYRRDVFEECGVFREDFWMLGEDLDFSMRAAAAKGGAFTARVAVAHLPPEPLDRRAAASSHRSKFLALLQNLAFLAFRSPHSAHLRSYLPGNFRRYLRTEGFSPGNAHDAWSAFWQGAVCAQPAGTPAGARLRAGAQRRMRENRPE